MKIKTICVLGGTGFVGGHLVTHLANSGRRLKVLTRHRERHKALWILPNVKLVEADVHDPKALAEHFAGCDAVINLVGILNGSEAAFHAVHAELPRRVAAACRETGVDRLLHMSALNADRNGPSAYLRSKREGERAVLEAQGIQATSLRPSVIFGPDDSFFNRFAALLMLSPVLPLACPKARFAPVYVGDVVQAFEAALEQPATFGRHLELCGPRRYTLRELVEYTARVSGRRRLILGLNDSLSRLQGQIFQYMPGQPFTLDNYRSMQVDSVCHEDGFQVLGITPHSVEALVPGYFAGRGERSRYNLFRGTARRD